MNATMTRPTHTPKPVTDRQRDIVTRLARKHFDTPTATTMIALCDTYNVRTISPVITTLIEIDNKNPAGRTTTTPSTTPNHHGTDADLPTTPTGRYAVLGRFFKIDTYTEGRWAGRVFIRELDAHGTELADIRRHTEKHTICTAVAADPNGTLIAYGKATGTCGRCQLTLRDPESIARGIGPYCEADILGISVNAVYRDRTANPVATA